MKKINIQAYPQLNKLISMEEVFWQNPNLEKFDSGIRKSPLSYKDVMDAEERLKRFAPYIAKVFPVKLLGETDYIKRQQLTEKLSQGTHIVWGTGGSMVPKDIMRQYYQKGLDFEKI